jgi:pectinesterase
MKTFFLLFVFAVLFSWGAKSQSLEEKLADHINIVVAQDGTGHVATIEEAIDLVPENNSSRFVVFIRNGVYREKITVPSSKTNITLIGEDAEKVILTWDDYSGKIVGPDTITTNTSFSFAAEADDFTAMNLTFENSAGPVGQAVALRTNGDRQFFYGVRLIGHQDTYYTWGNIRNYLLDCYIEGTTDYIFGRSTVVFENCHIHSKKTGSYITAASTEEFAKFGYVFFNSRFTADDDIRDVALGRPWRPFAKTVIINSFLDDFIRPEGWSVWRGRETNHLNSFYAEYGNFGPGADASNRIEWSHQLTEVELETYTLQNIFSKHTYKDYFENDWLPIPENDPIYLIVAAHCK